MYVPRRKQKLDEHLFNGDSQCIRGFATRIRYINSHLTLTVNDISLK